MLIFPQIVTTLKRQSNITVSTTKAFNINNLSLLEIRLLLYISVYYSCILQYITLVYFSILLIKQLPQCQLEIQRSQHVASYCHLMPIRAISIEKVKRTKPHPPPHPP